MTTTHATTIARAPEPRTGSTVVEPASASGSHRVAAWIGLVLASLLVWAVIVGGASFLFGLV